ncbi:MAG: M48 family metalloprotease [Marivibrio sp.]|uniref:M48 family metalloprotease n=1 Tax=Marivibrio sp. TaxID=2039719 RepID=UPI0032EE1EC5
MQDKTRSFSRRGFLQTGVCVAAAGCLGGCVSTNRATGDTSFTGLMSIQDDIELGRREHPKLVKQFGGEYENPRLQSYVARLGERAAAYAEYQEFPYKFTIVNSPIINAFALPGGFVYISRGLLSFASNEAELMGVLSHEIGHVNARHTAERVSSSQLAQGLVLLGAVATGSRALAQAGSTAAGLALQSFSREQEFEADSLGIRYMSRAGYDPDAMSTFLATLREYTQVHAKIQGRDPGVVDETNLMATHPRTIERVQRARQQAVGAAPGATRVAREPYLSQIDGMLYGDDPSQGIIDGTAFKHPDLRLAFTAPENFTLLNAPDQVVAFSPDRAATILFDGAKVPTSRSMQAYLQQDWSGAQIRLQDLEPINVNGLQAATGWARLNGDQGPVDLRGVAIRFDGEQVYRFRFITEPQATERFSQALRETTYSFRRLDPEEAARITAHRLLVVPVQPGDTVAGLSRGMPHGRYNEEMFRVLNDLTGGQTPPSGGLVKTVAS